MPSPKRKPTPKPNTVQEPIIESSVAEETAVVTAAEAQEVETELKSFNSENAVDLDLDSEFETHNNAKFTRMFPEHFPYFPRSVYFDNLTSPFVSESYSLIPDATFNKATVLILWDNVGVWVLLELEKLERKIVSERILKLVSIENQFNFLNNLKLQFSINEFEKFENHNKENNG